MNIQNRARWKYHYTIADHLGNARVEFVPHNGGQPEVVQSVSYYPFGYTLHCNDYGSRQPNRHLFGGKELQDQTLAGITFGWYDFEARMYDPAIGRFMQTDPMAENNAWLTPYHYCSNNPVRKIDPTGMLDDWFENEETGEIYYNVNMHEGDEGTGDMKGSGWKWLGPNGMFTDGDMEAEISLIAQNHGRIDMGRGDISLMLDSNSAKSFMSTQDYKQVPTQTLEYSYSYTESYSTIPGHSFHITYGENYRYWEKVAYVPKDFDVISTIPVGQVLYGKQHSYPFYIPQVTRNIYSYEQPTIWRFLGKTIKTLNGYHDYVNSYDCGSVDNYIKNGGGNPLIDLYIKRYPK